MPNVDDPRTPKSEKWPEPYISPPPKKGEKIGKYRIKKYRPSSTNCHSELLAHCSQMLNLACMLF